MIYSSIMGLVACTARPDEKCHNENKLLVYEKLRDINVNVIGKQYQHGAQQVIVEDTLLLYYALDIDRKKIDIYNLTNAAYKETVRLKSEGPDAVLGLSYMYVVSPDSIYLMASFSNSLYLINSEGKVVRKWLFNTSLPDSLRNSRYSAGTYTLLGLGQPEFFYVPFWVNKKGTELRAIINYDNIYTDNRDFSYQYSLSPIAHFNLVKNTFVKFTGKYPGLYLNSSRPHNALHRFVVVNNIDVLSFTSSDKVYCQRNDTFICARSNYAPRSITLFREGDEQDEEAEINSYVTEGSYSGLIKDPYRRRIYRIYSHPQERLNLEGLQNRKNETPWSILILDYDGNMKGEVVFEKKKYDYFNVHVVPEGLLLSKENSSNPGNQEDLLEFDIIRIIE